MLLSVMVGCSKKSDLPFSVIDYSCNNGWTSVYSVKVDSVGQTYIQGEDIKNGKWFIRTEISTATLDSLCTIVNKIDYTKLDTLYEKNCVDCGYYYLIINRTKESATKVLVKDNSNNDKDIAEINELSHFLDSLVRTIRSNIESVQFESKTKGFYLVSPP